MSIASSTFTKIAKRNCVKSWDVHRLFENRIPKKDLDGVIELWTCCYENNHGIIVGQAEIDTIIRAYQVVEGDMESLELLIQFCLDNPCYQSLDDCLNKAINAYEEEGSQFFYRDVNNFL